MRKEKAATLVVIAVLVCSGLVATVRAEKTIHDAVHISPGTYYGNLNESHTLDFWNFTAYDTHRINVTMIPPATADFQLELSSPTGTLKNGSYNPTGVTENVQYHADSDGNWTIRVSRFLGEGNYTLILAPVNFPPATPAAPLGPESGYVYTYYAYNASTTDRENDTIRYLFDWGDGTSNLTSLYQSGQIATVMHQWTRPQTYIVVVTAQDNHGSWSNPSDAKNISLSQNDCESGRDAGGNPATAVILPPDSYVQKRFLSWGTLYASNPSDQADFFNFTAQVGNRIHVEMTPPINADFQLELHGPNGYVNGSYNGPGQTERISYTADLPGNWSARVSRYTGEGKYTFELSVNLGPNLILRASIYPNLESVTFWVDDTAYFAYWNAPVSLYPSEGDHTIKAQDGFVRQIGDVYYWYYFYKWSDGVTQIQRTINLTQDTTLTAQYLRSRYGWY